jgi:hypothetical protein
MVATEAEEPTTDLTPEELAEPTTDSISYLELVVGEAIRGMCVRDLDEAFSAVRTERDRLRTFVYQVAEAPDAMVCRLTRDAAKQVLRA